MTQNNTTRHRRPHVQLSVVYAEAPNTRQQQPVGFGMPFHYVYAPLRETSSTCHTWCDATWVVMGGFDGRGETQRQERWAHRKAPPPSPPPSGEDHPHQALLVGRTACEQDLPAA